MILVLGGTTEGRELAHRLQRVGFSVSLTTVSSYGEQLARQGGVQDVMGKALTFHDLEQLLIKDQIKVLLDATHPYAEEIRTKAIRVAAKLGIPYGRLERETSPIPTHSLLYQVEDYPAAAQLAGRLGERIFLTIGSRRLKYFTQEPTLQGKTIFARVLPQGEVINYCHQLGLTPGQIIAAQGPFDQQANLWMLKHFQAQVAVTKESGPTGGFTAKWEAVLALGIPLVVISRPRQKVPNCFYQQEEIVQFAKEVMKNDEGHSNSRSWQ